MVLIGISCTLLRVYHDVVANLAFKMVFLAKIDYITFPMFNLLLITIVYRKI